MMTLERLRFAPLILLVLLLTSGTSLATSEEGKKARTTFFISPAGGDWNSGESAKVPFRSFRHAFAKMSAGDELVLLDGVYSEAAGTGYISYVDVRSNVGGPNSAQIPPGLDSARPTYVRALNPGKVKVNGQLVVGRSFRKDSYITIQGITFEGGGALYNTSHVTVKDCGFHGGFGIGTDDHRQGNDYNLIEDVWIWASGERIIAINYRSRYNVWRRVLVRGDGCGTPRCRGSGNPNVGITVYDSSHISLQNVMVVDRILAPGDSPYGDFAVAQHTPGNYLFGESEWLGTISLKAPDTGYYIEPDSGGTLDPTIRITNAVAWDSTYLGFNIARAGTNNVLENLTVKALGGDGIRVAPVLTTGTLRNVISLDAKRVGINSKYPPSHVNVFNAREGAFGQTVCTVGCYTRNPTADGATPSLRYLTRIEEGSFLKGKGSGGADIGANILYRYGSDGTHYGEPNYNTLSSAPLWPWPNQDRIKKELCEGSGVTRGFCQVGSLTKYIWEYLGNPMPRDPYGNQSATHQEKRPSLNLGTNWQRH
jgi:hypothetical protein